MSVILGGKGFCGESYPVVNYSDSGWVSKILTVGLSGIFLLSALTVPAFSSDRQKMLEISELVQGNLFNGGFEALDKLEQKLRLSKERSPNGESMLGLFFDTFEQSIFEVRHSYHAPDSFVVKHLDKWLEANPGSLPANIARAIYFKNHAQQIERSQRGQPASKSGFDRVKAYQSSSRRLVDQLITRYGPHPQLSVIALQLSALEGASELDLLTEHARELAKFPDYDPINYAVLDELVARSMSHGNTPSSRHLIGSFTASVLTYAGDNAGPTAYAHLYIRLFRKHLKLQTLEYVGMSWSPLRMGMDQIVEAHGTAENKNIAALFGCLAGSPEMATKHWPKTLKSIVKEIWQEPLVYQTCKEWLQSAPKDNKL